MSIVYLPEKDGTIKYRVLHKAGNLFWLEDNWGEHFVYDNAVAAKYTPVYATPFNGQPLTWAKDNKGIGVACNQTIGIKDTINGWIRRLYTQYNLLGTQMSIADAATFAHVMTLFPAAIKEMQREIQDLAPALIPNSPKNFNTGTLHITQGQIATGAQGDYRFIITSASLQIKFREEQLAILTIVRKKKTPLGVDKLNAHGLFQGMNLSRVLMVMLAQETLRHATTEGIALTTFAVGVDSDITNWDFWRLYSSNARTLLLRGDHQTIDIPTNPLTER
jgi:hypothetical protein